jgi:hypothetical protein
MLKTENLDEKECKGLIVAFAEMVHFDNYFISAKQVWN